MAKRLILGRAGTGKTRLAMEEVARRIRDGTDDEALLLVPTYGRGEQLKRSLLQFLGDGDRGFLDRSIVTFTSLAERVLGGTAINALASAGARDHRVRRALETVRTPVFERVRGFAGFRDRFLGLVKEVKEAGLDPGETAAALEELVAATEGGAARSRLRGFADVFAEYARLLREEGLVDHEDFQRALLEALQEGRKLPHALERIRWLGVDGFTNFTKLQLEVLDLLALRVPEAVVTLPDDSLRRALFEPARETREHFEGEGWRVERLDAIHRTDRGDLLRLEGTLFADAAPATAPPDGSLLLLRCADPADEADRVARRAALWIRRDGWKPFEILLVWRSLAGVRPLLEEAFARHGVPLRVFAARPLSAEPVARAAMDLLRLALGAGDPEAALAVARSGFVIGADGAEGDRLAEEVERRGLPADAAGLLALARDLGLQETARLLSSLPAPGADRDPAVLGGEALAAMAVGTRLRPGWLPDPARAGEEIDEARAATDAAAVTALQDLVAEVARSLRREGRAAVPPRDFLAAVEESVARAAFQPLDRRLHAVNAVDVVEARQWQARGVIVGGLLEKQFPRAPREDLFLRDRERRLANRDRRLRFAERLRAREEERLLFYTACTRASERLVLSFPATGAGGERLLASTFLDEVMRLWPEGERPVSESRLSDPAPLPEEALEPRDLLRGALVQAAEPFRPGTEEAIRAAAAGALVDALAARVKGRRLAALARAAALAADPAAELRAPRLRARFLRPFRTSASGLKDFHQCAYLHFASRVLGLSSPDRDAEEGLGPLRLGTVVHGALEDWFAENRTGDVGALFDARLAGETGGVRPGLDDHAQALRAREGLLVFARAEAARVDGRSHRPALFEHDFGLSPEGAPPLRFLLGRRRIEVRGQFDRVDLAPDGSAVAVDYKTRWTEKPYDEGAHEEALSGADPQVPLYWLALRDALRRVPAGIEIAEVGTLQVTGLRAEGAPEAIAPDGATIMDAGAVAELEGKMKDLLVRASDSLVHGVIPAKPADPERCGAGRCDFADLCRFEKWKAPRGGGGRP